MPRVSRLARAAGVCALVLSALVLGVAPVDAVTSSPAVAATGSFSSVTEGTVTVTYSNFTYPFVYVYAEGNVCPDPAGGSISTPPLFSIGTASPLGASPVTITVDTPVVPGTTLPPDGYTFCLFDSVSPDSAYLIAEGAASIYTPMTSAFVTNSDGTLTLTYANANPDVDQEGLLFFLNSVTECSEAPPSTATGFWLLVGYNSIGAASASPALIEAGTPAMEYPPTSPGLVPIAAGKYQICLYQTDRDGNMTLRQSESFVLGPVTPAFTG